MSFIYLASPYSHEDLAIVQLRFEQAEEYTAGILRAGYFVYSPIVHCHGLAVKYKLPKDFAFWQRYNRAVLAKASELWVLTLEGWGQSRGVTEEIAFAESCGIPVFLKEGL